MSTEAVMGCKLGDRLTGAGRAVWTVRGVNLINGNLYVESEEGKNLRADTVTAATADKWRRPRPGKDGR